PSRATCWAAVPDTGAAQITCRYGRRRHHARTTARVDRRDRRTGRELPDCHPPVRRERGRDRRTPGRHPARTCRRGGRGQCSRTRPESGPCPCERTAAGVTRTHRTCRGTHRGHHCRERQTPVLGPDRGGPGSHGVPDRRGTGTALRRTTTTSGRRPERRAPDGVGATQPTWAGPGDRTVQLSVAPGGTQGGSGTGGGSAGRGQTVATNTVVRVDSRGDSCGDKPCPRGVLGTAHWGRHDR